MAERANHRSLRDVAEELAGRWLPEGSQGWSVDSIARELGLVTREELEDVQLRLAQLEHRLRLLEPPGGGP